MDFASITAALSSIKSATDIAKLIKDSEVSLEKAETKLKLAELISALADTKIQIAEIQQTLIDKDTEISALSGKLKVKGMVQWQSPYYWVIEEAGREGPFCQHCYDKNHELIRLQGNGEGYWECKACKCNFTDATYKSSGVSTISRRNYDPLEGF